MECQKKKIKNKKFESLFMLNDNYMLLILMQSNSVSILNSIKIKILWSSLQK